MRECPEALDQGLQAERGGCLQLQRWHAAFLQVKASSPRRRTAGSWKRPRPRSCKAKVKNYTSVRRGGAGSLPGPRFRLEAPDRTGGQDVWIRDRVSTGPHDEGERRRNDKANCHRLVEVRRQREGKGPGAHRPPKIVDVLSMLRSGSSENNKGAASTSWMAWTPTLEGTTIKWSWWGPTDAYCHFAVAHVFVAMLFGFKAAPLNMGRLSAAFARLWQSMMMQLQVYMDDPFFILVGPRSQRKAVLSMLLYTAVAMGISLAFHKGERGLLRLTWIGIQMELNVTHEEKMAAKLRDKVRSWKGKGMVGLRDLSWVGI